MSTRRSDIKGYIEERTKGRRDWPSDRYLAVRFASRVAAQLDQLREQQGLSYEALADRAGTSKAQVIRLLSGTYDGMTTKSMAKLAAALRCEIDVRIRRVADVSATARPLAAKHRDQAFARSSYRAAGAATVLGRMASRSRASARPAHGGALRRSG